MVDISLNSQDISILSSQGHHHNRPSSLSHVKYVINHVENRESTQNKQIFFNDKEVSHEFSFVL